MEVIVWFWIVRDVAGEMANFTPREGYHKKIYYKGQGRSIKELINDNCQNCIDNCGKATCHAGSKTRNMTDRLERKSVKISGGDAHLKKDACLPNEINDKGLGDVRRGL